MTQIKRIKGGTDNCYIVSDGNAAILIDTASSANLDQVIAECDKYEMRLIVLTHVHFDHAENASKLSKRYNIPVAFNKMDEELFESFEKQPLKPQGAVGKVVLGLSLKVLKNTKVERPGVGHLYYDPDSIKKSAEKIRSLGERTIYYGHGDPTDNGKF